MAAARTPQDTGFGYRPALDGLRALAVAAVLLFHGGVGWLPGGFLGVDAFFVLSGFLITSLLITEQVRDGRIRLGAFWLRRARRLLPALIVVVIFVVLTFRRILAAEEVGLLRGDALATLGYAANWRMIYRGADYFAQSANPSPLQHAWSLGIEEQFYIVWPLLLVALFWSYRRLRRDEVGRQATLAALCVAGAIGSAVAAGLLFRPTDANRAYFGTDSRAQALLIGCAVAALLGTARRRLQPRAGVALGVAGLVVAGWLWTHVHGTDPALFHGGLIIDAIAVGALIVHIELSPHGTFATALSVAPLVWLGRLSYGVYLWHWPLFALLDAERTGLTGPTLLLLRLTATLTVAAASYVLIEQPARTGRLGWSRATFVAPRRRGALTAATAAGCLVAAGGLVVTATMPTPIRPAAPVYAVPAPRPAPAKQPVATETPMTRPGRRAGATPRIAFFGDSVSWTLGTYLPPHPGLTVTVRAVQGCGIARLPDLLQVGTGGTNYPGCTTWDARWRRGIVADDPDVAVILLDRWELMDRRIDGAYHHVGEPVYDAYLTGELNLAISIAGSQGAQVVLLTAPYTHRAERPDGGLYDEDQPARVDAWNSLLYAAAARDPARVSTVDLNARVCPDHAFTWSIGALQIRSDGLHFTPAGVEQWIAPWLLPQLAEIALAPRPVLTNAPAAMAAPPHGR